VLTDKGEITGTTLLLAAGAWTARMTRQLGIPLPIRPGKGYSVDYSPAPVKLRTSLTLEDARVAVTPLNGFLRLAGTMEFGDLEETINPRRVAAIKKAAAQALTGWDNPPGERPPWAGLRPMTPDGLPIIGQLHPLPNVYVASGHGMLGLTLAPATAEIITEAITQQHIPPSRKPSPRAASPAGNPRQPPVRPAGPRFRSPGAVSLVVAGVGFEPT
jgi:D-amino-acid dehydrogenase